MIPISAPLKAHLAQPYQTTCTLWKVTLANSTVLGFTDLDVDVVFGGVTYLAATGYSRTDIATASDLSVDNLEVDGIISSPSITEAALADGTWDYAQVQIMLVNWADLTMGALILRVGWLGEVTLERDSFKSELRGLSQAYSRSIGELTSPSCRADLYDARCKVNPATFTKTGTITGVNADGVTLYDTSRTEPGPAGGINITGITTANPGVVTLASAPTPALLNLQLVTLSGIVGPDALNTLMVAKNASGTTFEIVDTSALPAYVSGGVMTPLGATSGYFDYGKIGFTSGLNSGFGMEIKSYVPKQFTLELPMPYAVQVGDTYIALAGCDKFLATCKNKFSNVINFRGEPYLPGIDKMVQIGKQP